MNALEQQLLRSKIGATEPRLCIRSQTCVDTGRWWRRSPVWLCVTDDELLMLAVSRRQYLACAAIRDIRSSRYHHASGELVVEPDMALSLHRFKLSVHDALRILNLIHTTADIHQQPQATS